MYRISLSKMMFLKQNLTSHDRVSACTFLFHSGGFSRIVLPPRKTCRCAIWNLILKKPPKWNIKVHAETQSRHVKFCFKNTCFAQVHNKFIKNGVFETKLHISWPGFRGYFSVPFGGVFSNSVTTMQNMSLCDIKLHINKTSQIEHSNPWYVNICLKNIHSYWIKKKVFETKLYITRPGFDMYFSVPFGSFLYRRYLDDS